MKAQVKQKDPKIWEIRDMALTLDLSDLPTMERYENAFERMREAEEAVPRDGKASEMLRGYLHMYEVLFRELFPEEADKLFDGLAQNVSVYEDMYMSFLEFVAAQQNASVQRRMERLSKYRPAGRKK
ncbi:MAG: hypothetical protein IKN55_07775 [Oscillospiraceae bacterium]|nr:hypothetical protein [Oscillospiraceae bacterium]